MITIMSKNRKAKCRQEIDINNEQIVQNETNIADDCYEYMKHIAEVIYENEERREDSIIQQASHMQTAFSFVIAAVFMATPVMMEYRGHLTESFFFVAISSISFLLLVSLIFATMAQNRKKREVFPSIESIRDKIENDYKLFQTIAAREKYLVKMYEKIHPSLEKSNDRRVLWVRLSMGSFYVALALCIFWYIVAIIKIL